jgi:4-hydroxy-tetrahydrodipicolinate synthase
MNDLRTSGLRTFLQGLWLPLVTPFSNGELDEASLRRLVRHYADGPVDGLILAATSGEGLTLGMAELERLVALTRTEIAESRRYVPICLGLSGASTRKMLDTLDETATWPIDGYLISSPYYSRPSQRGLLQHFGALADHASWPIVLYNIPYRTSVNLTNETLLQLSEHPNIVGLKDCGADRAQSIDLLRGRPAGFRILTGEDAQYYEALTDGADGAILLSAHIETETFASVRTLLKDGNRDGALARWESIAELTRLLFAEPSPAPAKYWLARTGLIDSAEVRLPMVEVSSELAARLDAEIERRLPSSQTRHSGMVRQHQTSDVQLHIGESRDSGFDASHRPGMTGFNSQ